MREEQAERPSTQDVMRLAIRRGHYVSGKQYATGGTCYMCTAVERLRMSGEINQVVERRVKREIGQYMIELTGDGTDRPLMGMACGVRWEHGPHVGVVSTLYDDWAWAWNVGRVLYWNWDRRPRFQQD